MTTIGITGATGFVGSQILKELLNSGYRVRVITRNSGRANIEPTSLAKEIVYTKDIFSESRTALREILTGIDVVIHAAWYVVPGKYLNSEENFRCLYGTLNLAQGCADAGVRKFIGIGTCFEYDLNGTLLSVDTHLKPESIYASSKVATYYLLREYFAKMDIEFAWCRLFYLYGEGEPEGRLVSYLNDMLSRGEHAELTSGEQVRDFMDVKLAGKIIADIVRYPKLGPINVCTGKGISIRELAEDIADKYGRRDLLQFGKRRDNIMDPSSVIGIPNW